MKIADFGLATTTELVFKQKQKMTAIISSSKDGSSQTGHVGTSYYVAPELKTEKASKSTYGAKSDIYSLGMIYFELKHPTFGTDMERDKVMTNAQSNQFPEFMRNPDKNSMARVRICIYNLYPKTNKVITIFSSNFLLRLSKKCLIMIHKSGQSQPKFIGS